MYSMWRDSQHLSGFIVLACWTWHCTWNDYNYFYEIEIWNYGLDHSCFVSNCLGLCCDWREKGLSSQIQSLITAFLYISHDKKNAHYCCNKEEAGFCWVFSTHKSWQILQQTHDTCTYHECLLLVFEVTLLAALFNTFNFFFCSWLNKGMF